MADLVVDTDALHAASMEVAEAAAIAEGLGDRGGRLRALVPAVGRTLAAEALAAFGDSCIYSVGWIATQGRELSRRYLLAAVTYATAEAKLTAAAGGTAPQVHVPAGASAGPAPEPVRPNWALLAHPGTVVLVRLGSATHVRQLVPGDPEQVRTLGRSLSAFAEELGQARAACSRVSFGGWTGAAASTTEEATVLLLKRLTWAEFTFDEAGAALVSYANVQAEAQLMAEKARVDFQIAEHADKLARGVLVAGTGGPVLLAVGLDPQAEMRRAVLLWQEAQAMMDTAEKNLVATLEVARAGAPTDPGWFGQFMLGLEEGLTGLLTAPVHLAKLAYRLSPNRLAYDPHGWLADQDAFWGGVSYALTHPKETGKDLIDYDTWAQSPARALGKLTPEALLALAGVGAAAAAGRTGSKGRLQTVADDLDLADRNGGVYPRVSEARLVQRIRQLGHRPGSPAAYGAGLQLRPPFGTPDHWVPTTLRPGQRIAIPPGGFASPADWPLPRSSREFFESVQQPPSRERDPGGDVSQPRHDGSVPVYEVHGEIDAATATALANPQFGPGLGTNISFDIDEALASGKLVEVDPHRFDPGTVTSRIEDPQFKAVDDTLPDRALDPDREGRLAGARAAGEEIRDYPLGPAAAAAAATLDNPQQPDPSEHPDHQGAR